MPSVKNEDVRLARTTEAIQIIKKLWERSKKKKEEDNSKNSSFVDFDGQYFKIKNAKLYTPPSSEKIPLYMAISRFVSSLAVPTVAIFLIVELAVATYPVAQWPICRVLYSVQSLWVIKDFGNPLSIIL
jgi:hypothetical protein